MASAPVPGDENAKAAKCGAKNRSGGTCAKPPGWGTDHVGYGNCKFHGGATPNGIKHAARLVATSLADELHIEPDEALLWMVDRAATRVAYWIVKVGQLEPDEVVVSQVRERVWSGGEAGGGAETITSTHAELHIAVRALVEAEADLTKAAKTALDAGVEERRVRVVEQFGAQLADLLRGVLDELELSAEQRARAPGIVQRNLVALEGGAAA